MGVRGWVSARDPAAIAWFASLAASMGWASNLVVGRALAPHLSPVTMSFWRLLMASVILAALAGPRLVRDMPVLLRAWRPILLLAFLGIFVTNVLTYWALRHTTALNASLLNSIGPVYVLGLSFVLFGDRIGLRQLAGVLVSMLGAILIITRGDPGVLARLDINLGDGIILFALLCYAGYTTALRLRPRVHTLSFTFASFFLGWIGFLPLWLSELADGGKAMPELRDLLGVLFLTLVPGIGAYVAFTFGVQRLGANRAGQFLHMVPLFGALFAVLLLGEQLHGFHLAGAGLIAGGLLLAGRRDAARAQAGA